jgi:hypothetical protein
MARSTRGKQDQVHGAVQPRFYDFLPPVYPC